MTRRNVAKTTKGAGSAQLAQERPQKHSQKRQDWPRSFAPGAGILDEPEPPRPHPDGFATHCGGCRAHPLDTCACCGAPTDIVIPSDASHSFTFCRRCYRAVQAVRVQSRAERDVFAARSAAKAAKTAKTAKGAGSAQERPQKRQKRPAPTPDISPVNAAPARANERTGSRRSRSHKRGAA